MATMLKKRALLIGIDKYLLLSCKEQLNGCKNDVKLMRELLLTCFNFNENEITMLVDEIEPQPTRSNILTALENLKGEKVDLILIHFSGHGSRRFNTKTSQWNETIVPMDSGSESLENRDITDDELNAALVGLAEKGNEIVFIFDSCHSRHIALDTVESTSVRSVMSCHTSDDLPLLFLASTSINDSLTKRSCNWFPQGQQYTLLAACRGDEEAFEVKSESGASYGTWTLTLVKGIYRLIGRGFKSGSFTYSDLFHYTLPSVTINCFPPKQHSIFEGDPRRQVFGLNRQTTELYASVLKRQNEKVKMNIGTVHGVTQGSVFTLCSMNTCDQQHHPVHPQDDRVDEHNQSVNQYDSTIARVRVTSLKSTRSWADRIRSDTGDRWNEVAPGCRAFETVHQFALPCVAVCIKREPKIEEISFNEHVTYLLDFLNKCPFLNHSEEPSEAYGVYCITVCVLGPRTESEPFVEEISFLSERSYIILGAHNVPESSMTFPLTVDGTRRLCKKLSQIGTYYRAMFLENTSLTNNPLNGTVDFKLLHRTNEKSEWADASSDCIPIFHEGEFVAVNVENRGSRNVYIGVISFAENDSLNILYPPIAPDINVPDTSGSGVLVAGNSMLVKANLDKLCSHCLYRSVQTIKVFASLQPIDFAVLTQEVFHTTNTSVPLRSSLQRLLEGDASWHLEQHNADINSKTLNLNQDCWITLLRSFSTIPSLKSQIRLSFLEIWRTSTAVEEVLQQMVKTTESDGVERIVDTFLTVVAAVLSDFMPEEDDLTHGEIIQRFCHGFQNFCDLEVEEESLEKTVQIAVAKAGMAAFVPAVALGSERAKCYLMVGELLTEAHLDDIPVALCAFQKCLEIVKEECNAKDFLGSALLGIGVSHSRFFHEKPDSAEQIEHASTALSKFQEAEEVFANIPSSVDELIRLKYNRAKLLQIIMKRDYGKSFWERAVTVTEEDMKFVKDIANSSDADEQWADLCFALADVRCYLSTFNSIAFPWQEDVITLCEPLVSTNNIELDRGFVRQCCQLISEAYLHRVAGYRGQNFVDAIKYAKTSLDLGEGEADPMETARTAINLAAAIQELQSAVVDTDEEWMSEQKAFAKAKLEAVACCEPVLNNFDFMLRIKYCLLLMNGDTSGSHLRELLTDEAVSQSPEVAAHFLATLASDALDACLYVEGTSIDTLDRISKAIDSVVSEPISKKPKSCTSFPSLALLKAKYFEIDNEIDFMPIRLLRCKGGNYCAHNDDVLAYLKKADECFNMVEHTRQPNQIRNLVGMGRYWATHCGLHDENERLNLAFSVYWKAIQILEQNWPSYSLAAQVEMIKEIAGVLWHQAIDVALCLVETEGDKLISILTLVKSRNLLPIVRTPDSVYLEHSSQIGETYLQLSALPLLRVTEGILDGKILRNTLNSNEVVVEWWISTTMDAACIAYTNDCSPVLLLRWEFWDSNHSSVLEHLFHRVEESTLRHWNVEFLESLSELLHLKDLLKLLKEKFSRATKMLLIPNNLLHGCPLHALPLSSSPSDCLLKYYPDGISYLPSASLLHRRQTSKKWNVQSVLEHVLMFQADPLKDLPNSETELDRIQEVLNSAITETNAISARPTFQAFYKATAQQFLSTCSTADCTLLHVASHGKWNFEESHKSFLQFQDKEVRLEDIKKLTLPNCQLIVLSACDSGIRDFHAAGFTEIFSGFGAQFLAAGCSNVLLTTSPVPDRSTADFVTNFYKQLFLEKKQITKALRDLQLDYLNSNELAKMTQSETATLRKVGNTCTAFHPYNNSIIPVFSFILTGID